MRTDIEATDATGQEAFYAGIDAAGERLRAFNPELVVTFYPDHMIGFFLDLMPSFCVALGAQSAVEFGIEQTPLRVPKALGEQLVRHLHEQGFDTAFSHKLVVDHGVSLPLIQLTGGVDTYEVLPIFVNCAGDPRPSFQRTRLFGAEVGKFLATTGKRVAVIGSGGLSHDSPTSRIAKATPERFLRENKRSAEEQIEFEHRGVENARGVVAGSNEGSKLPSETWDREFLDSFVAFDERRLDGITDDEIDNDVGGGTHEVRSWVAAAACARELGPIESEVVFYKVILEWITGMAIVLGSDGA
jgi:2,3-dihydroxyphenylpropionate 1,2-dioxygenase